MVKNIVLIFSILFLSIFLVGLAYILKNKDICCKYELCKQLTTVCVEEDGKEQEEESEKGDTIYLDGVKSGDVLSVEDEVLGRAPSSWYFEGTFPVRIFNQQGDEIASLFAVATEEWAQEGDVPFSLELHSNLIELDEESIVVMQFEKDNPSGLEENADYLKITVTLKPVEEEKIITFKVFFPNDEMSDMEDCTLVYPIVREVPYTVAVGRAALEELFKGLAGTEPDNGYFTNIPEGVKVQSLSIEGGVARVDLSEELEEGVGGSCMVASITAQITETLKQFPTVDSVVISIDGRTEDILQP
ncbi:MAG: GerMN domain-containing protein [Candidatus Dojkabacteria bacterium]|jgi:hypothetical protein|nr:GerMN domain-containing protein [Candidatus Dojkabacteria bacterium]